MKKIIKKIGLSAGVALALMFTMSLLAGAQEKATIPMDKTEVKEWVATKVLTGTDQKLSTNLPRKTNTLAFQWFVYVQSDHPTNLTEAKTPNYYQPTGSADPDDELCGGSSNLCAIWAETDETDPMNPVPLIAGQAVETAINNYFNLNQDNDSFLREKN